MNSTSNNTDDVESLLVWIREYSEKRISPNLMNERRTIMPHVLLDMGNKGLMGMVVPKEFGGLGFGFQDSNRVIQQMAAVDLSLAIFVGLNNVLGIFPIVQHASIETKSRLLPDLARGRILASFAITEEGAGSNVPAISARVLANASGFQLTGKKIWIGSAAWSSVMSVFAKEEDEAGKVCGVSGFVVATNQDGVTCGMEAMTMGVRAMVQNEVSFEQVHLKSADRLGERAQGLQVAYETMNAARFGLTSICVGGMKRALQILNRYLETRVVASGKLSDHPLNQEKMWRMNSAISVLDSMTSKVGRLLDQKTAVPEEVFLACKILAPEYLFSGLDSVMQSLGGRGYIEANQIPQMFRDARLIRIFEGPTETLQGHLGSKLYATSKSVDDLASFFEGQKPAQRDVWARFHGDREKILAFSNGDFKTGPEKVTAKTMGKQLLGSLASKAMLWAFAVEGGSDAVVWAQHEYESEMEKIERQIDVFGCIKGHSQRARVTAFTKDIGDIELNVAGENWTTDPLLKRK